MKSAKAFTLVEWIIVVAVVGALVLILTPNLMGLSPGSRASATKRALAAVRATLAIKYAQSAARGADASYPSSLTAADFFDGVTPKNAITNHAGAIGVDGVQGGTATHATRGFWYVTQLGPDYGRAGAYSNGAIDTSSY